VILPTGSEPRNAIQTCRYVPRKSCFFFYQLLLVSVTAKSIVCECVCSCLWVESVGLNWPECYY